MTDPIPPEHQPGMVTAQPAAFCPNCGETCPNDVSSCCGERPVAALVTAGGWCAPAAVLYPDGPRAASMLAALASETVAVRAPRAGIDYQALADRQAERLTEGAAYAAMMERHVGAIIDVQHQAIELACAQALANDWDVHVHRRPYTTMDTPPYALRFIGIEHRPARYAVPTIVEHTARWDDDPMWWDL